MRELLVRCDVTLLNIYDDQGMYQTSKDIHALEIHALHLARGAVARIQ